MADRRPIIQWPPSIGLGSLLAFLVLIGCFVLMIMHGPSEDLVLGFLLALAILLG